MRTGSQADRILNRARADGATVCGVGVSNLPLIDFLVGRGISVTARDRKSREDIGEELAAGLESRGVRLVFGEGYLSGICEGVIFRTPGLRPDVPELVGAQRRGAILTSEMELFFELTPATVIGITGSDGKTTTTTLTYMFLDAQLRRNGRGRAYVGGNIGEPLLPRVDEMTDDDFAVVELSSFQLMTMKRSPNRAAITNITPNHLDWHRGMDEYAAAKTNIFTHGAARLTVNADNSATRAIGRDAGQVEVTFFSSGGHRYEDVVPKGRGGSPAIFERDGVIVRSLGGECEELLAVSDILLPGRHNVENYMTAIANTYGIVSKDIYRDIARTFRGVEHRLELVREVDGVKYYNSSIDSSPTRTAAALSALPVKPVVICGGYDKHIPFAPLAEALCERAAGVVLTGATAGKIAEALDDCPAYSPERLPVERVGDFREAVLAARRMAEPHGIVLLSPACASFDRFRNFAERGRVFKEIVNGL